MALALRLMTSDEFDGFRTRFVREWGEDLARADDLPLDEAVRRAEEDVDAQLPDGAGTKDHFLYTLRDGERGVGTLWYSINAAGEAFLDDVTVAVEERRKGYGRQALALLEAEARSRGCERILLNVYGHNAGAFALYEACGYVTKRREMAKAL